MFWFFAVPSLIVIFAVMGLIAWKAREVPDNGHEKRPHRLNPELIRILTYGIVIVVCLAAALYEISLYEDLPEP